MTHFVKNAMLPTHTAIVVDDDRDVNIVLAGILKLKKFDVHKVYSALLISYTIVLQLF